MMVFPPNLPKISITKVGMQDITSGNASTVVLLPPGSAETQTININVENFGTVVPLQAVVTPDQGSKSTINFEVDNTAGGATEGTVDVVIPIGVTSRIDVWTR